VTRVSSFTAGGGVLQPDNKSPANRINAKFFFTFFLTILSIYLHVVYQNTAVHLHWGGSAVG